MLTPTTIIMAIALLASLSVYFTSDSPSYLRFFPPFLFITLFVELAGEYIVKKGGYNTAWYNVYYILGFFFYLFVMGKIVRKTLAKEIIRWASVLLTLLAILNLLYVQKINSFNSFTFLLGALLIVSSCIYYFFELFQLPVAVNLLREPGFWISSALLFYFVCSFPFYGFVNFISIETVASIYKFGYLLDFINVLFFLLLIIAFICRIQKKSTIIIP